MSSAVGRRANDGGVGHRAAPPPGYADLGQRVLDEPDDRVVGGLRLLDQRDMAGVGHDHQLGVGQLFRHLSAVGRRRQQVVVTAGDQHPSTGERVQRGELVVLHERRVVVRDHLDTGRGDHRRHEVDDGRVDVLRREAELAGDGPGHVAPERSTALDQARVTSRVAQYQRQQGALHAGEQRREPQRYRGELAGRRRHERDPADAAREQLWVLIGQRQDRHAAHRVADEDDRAVGGDGGQHSGEIAAELVDRGPLGRALVRPTVGTLVEEHHPNPIAELGGDRAPLEEETSQVEREPVDEHDRQRRGERPDLFVISPAPSSAAITPFRSTG